MTTIEYMKTIGYLETVAIINGAPTRVPDASCRTYYDYNTGLYVAISYFERFALIHDKWVKVDLSNGVVSISRMRNNLNNFQWSKISEG